MKSSTAKRGNAFGEKVAGYVGLIGPRGQPRYFTGSGYSYAIDDAKLYDTPKGCLIAMRYWDEADYNVTGRLPSGLWATRRIHAVKLYIASPEIFPGQRSKA